ncbi:MAG: hypothetical protein LBL19_04955 [Spirochaetaceae bacterium]|jgi:hypothetical protein|nr:hypothetical protein [Spirochaetaceae bacterium]
MREKYLCFWVFFVFSPLLLYSQAYKPLVGIKPFTVQGIRTDEAGIIESLIQSYVEELGNEVVLLDPAFTIDTSSYDSALFRLPEYIFSGSIIREGENRNLLLELHTQTTGERILYSSTHKSLSDLVLKARSLVALAITAGAAAVREEAPAPEQLTVNRLTGTWRGDAEIQVVRFTRNLAGTAIFTSGAQMRLVYTIENNTLKVFQNSPNTERFYHPLPYRVAQQVSAEAEPIRWEFQLYEQGRLLRGKKIGTGVRYNGDTVLELVPGAEVGVEWTKYGR